MPSVLERLEELKSSFGPEAARERRLLVARLERATLRTAAEVERLHEALCFARAYPDDAETAAAVERALARFPRRRDLRRHAADLENSGIAGTDTSYPYFAPTARWLAARWPRALDLVWENVADDSRLERLLPLLAHYAETPALDEAPISTADWLERLRARDETAATFLVRRLAERYPDGFDFERTYEDLDLVLNLRPASGTPTRGSELAPRGPRRFQRRPLARARPDLRLEIDRPPRAVRQLSRRQGREMVDLARAAMVARARDLDAFAYGSEEDVRLIEWEDGLAFAAIGVVPERRLMLEAVYGFLTLKNRVPIGYVLNSALFGSAEIAYNVFSTFRGGEAALVYARVLATVRHLFHADAFTIFPYQLGDENEEAIESGAWWFYQKLGFRPRDGATLGLMRRELERMRRDAGHRSTAATLRRLARHNVYLSHGPERADVIGELPFAGVGLAVSDLLSRRFAHAPDRGLEAAAEVAAERLGAGPERGWSRGERLAFRRWAPLVLALPRWESWDADERRALLEVIRAKGGRRESDFVHRFDAHPRLRRAVASLARRHAPAD